MAEDGRNPTAVSGAVADEATGGAALIAIFYGPRDRGEIRTLHERLYRRLGPKPQASPAPGGWSNLDETTGLCFDPPGQGAHDTTAVQLGINAPGNTAGAWEEARGKLEGILDAGDLDGLWDGIWGYTLVYQAVLKEGFDPEKVLQELLPAVRRLHSGEVLAPLRRSKLPGGWAWLLGIPDRGDGPEAGMVYAALASEEQEAALINQFYSMSDKSTAELLPPDLIAHKGYYQMRQYRRGDLERKYEKNLGNLQETTDHLLEDLQKGDVEDLQEGDLNSDRLEELFRLYCRLLPVISALKELQVGVLQQSDNLDAWRSQVRDNEVLEFHQAQLEMATRELESKVEPLQFDLEMADKVVSAARLLMDKKLEDQRREAEKKEARERLEEERKEAHDQHLIQTLLAVVAAALALPVLIDKDLSAWLIGQIPILESFKDNTGAEFLVQLVLIAILAIPIWLGARWWLKRRRERDQDDDNQADDDREYTEASR